MRFYFGFSKRIPFKWILFAIGVILAFFGIHKIAFAATLLPPDTVQVYNANGQITYYNGAPSVVSWYYENGWTIPNSPQSNIQWSSPRFNFWFNQNNLCVGKVINTNITTLMYSNFPTSYNVDFNNNAFRLKVWNGRTESYCSLLSLSNNNKVAKWSCSFVHYQDSALFIYPQGLSFQYNNSQFGIAIGDSSTYGCSSTDSDIINNQTNNTNSIINNDNNNTTIIVNEQQNTTNAINGVNDSLNNSQVDSSSTNGGGFFDNFTVNDSRGFSSIITAPLQFLRDLLTSNASCNPLSFNIEMKDDNITVSNTGLTLPCGEVLWNRVPQAIELIWVTLVWGLVGYRLLLDMVKFINNSLNPEYSKEYFLDL